MGRPASTVYLGPGLSAGAPGRGAGAPGGVPRRLAVRLTAGAVVALLVASTAAALTVVARPAIAAGRDREWVPVTWSNADLVAIGADREPRAADAAAVAPIRVMAPSIGVDAAVDPLGLTTQGEMDVPTDFARVGWYEGSVTPGDAGVSVLAGHRDDADGPAVFYRLDRLKPGEEIQVQRSDGGTARYLVGEVKVFAKDQFPTDQVFGTAAGPGLRLITCVGRFDRKNRTYLDNLVVYATPAGAGA